MENINEHLGMVYLSIWEWMKVRERWEAGEYRLADGSTCRLEFGRAESEAENGVFCIEEDGTFWRSDILPATKSSPKDSDKHRSA